ncbi:hypothetical protein GCM10027598_07810 [Amycolatopsis oliviviridis]|uniref:DUF2283 domain-containing protein n=1 Tax=Amycolatopsis oliviviridis TaxID=1471590 RepID=A0ABQ3LTU3_9PSEU|nr:hypothetical protein [Amycolatopsis oliviviridis]GHH20857.1 hypothetical protein GCM10017790_41220 [Amycolatopsis oliviviridis]
MHTRLQLDPSAEISVRYDVSSDVWEIVALDPRSECSAVIELTTQQLLSITASTKKPSEGHR